MIAIKSNVAVQRENTPSSSYPARAHTPTSTIDCPFTFTACTDSHRLCFVYRTTFHETLHIDTNQRQHLECNMLLVISGEEVSVVFSLPSIVCSSVFCILFVSSRSHHWWGIRNLWGLSVPRLSSLHASLVCAGRALVARWREKKWKFFALEPQCFPRCQSVALICESGPHWSAWCIIESSMIPFILSLNSYFYMHLASIHL